MALLLLQELSDFILDELVVRSVSPSSSCKRADYLSQYVPHFRKATTYPCVPIRKG